MRNSDVKLYFLTGSILLLNLNKYSLLAYGNSSLKNPVIYVTDVPV